MMSGYKVKLLVDVYWAYGLFSHNGSYHAALTRVVFPVSMYDKGGLGLCSA